MRSAAMNRWTIGVVALAMLGVFLFILGSGRQAAVADDGATLVTLSAPEGSLEPDAHGTIQFFDDSLKFGVKDIPCPGSLPVPIEFKSQISVALYVRGAALDPVRLTTFVPTCSWDAFESPRTGSYQGVVGTLGRVNFEEVVDPVFDVWVEFDDGLNTPDSLGATPCNQSCRLLTGTP